MKRRIEQLRELSLFEWWVMLVAMILLPLVALSLRLVEFKKTRNILGHFISDESGQKEPNPSEIEKTCAIARMVAVAAGHGPYRANCLKQSLVLWWLLAVQGIASEIKFGVQRESEQFVGGHAWVECAGMILIDAQEVHQRISTFG